MNSVKMAFYKDVFEPLHSGVWAPRAGACQAVALVHGAVSCWQPKLAIVARPLASRAALARPARGARRRRRCRVGRCGAELTWNMV